ncbi:hypothetical protein GZH46_00186 [Fragariocoptes setiger]|uniref:Uncharacterized protein n=1 Tax=Fragariocoptes setiger TaxID=1670756 RepID=A0ABQ7SCV2_9ACAR|nr:hypothetical protein GZH46_00186 [Fragariocoptes setiger]
MAHPLSLTVTQTMAASMLQPLSTALTLVAIRHRIVWCPSICTTSMCWKLHQPAHKSDTCMRTIAISATMGVCNT